MAAWRKTVTSILMAWVFTFPRYCCFPAGTYRQFRRQPQNEQVGRFYQIINKVLNAVINAIRLTTTDSQCMVNKLLTHPLHQISS